MLKEVKPLHCQNVLNQMSVSDYGDSTIGLTRITMSVFFDDAVDNGLLERNPVTKSVKSMRRKEPAPRKAMSAEEQRMFLENAKNSSYYNQYSIILQTGLRVGELTGLKWSDVDFDKKCIHIVRTMDHRSGEWKVNTAKSKSGRRDIPLTDRAIEILLNEKQKRRTSNVIPIEYHDFVFLSPNGKPILNSAYNIILSKLCKKSGIENFTMHELRHTFATRCIEGGMTPKTLQEILGHANIGTTMDIYVHVTEDSKAREINGIETMLNVM